MTEVVLAYRNPTPPPTECPRCHAVLAWKPKQTDGTHYVRAICYCAEDDRLHVHYHVIGHEQEPD